MAQTLQNVIAGLLYGLVFQETQYTLKGLFAKSGYMCICTVI